MLQRRTRTLLPVQAAVGRSYTQKDVRETISERLGIVSEMIGSVTDFAREIDINRTQLSRYISGQSVPKPELLYRVSVTYDLPLSWLIVPHDDPIAALNEYRLSSELHNMYAKRQISVPETMLQDGFYRCWKGLFQSAGKYESYMCRVKMNNGVGTVRSNMVRHLKRLGHFTHSNSIDRTCRGVAMKSHSGVSVSFSDSIANVVGSCFLLPATTLRYSGNELLSGFMTLHYTPGRRQLNIVPVVWEAIPHTTGAILNAARGTGVFEEGELPNDIRTQIEYLEIPLYGIR